MKNHKEKIKSKEEITKLAIELKKQGKRIVTTSGIFDLLHIGHLESFIKTKEYGDVLIVGINSDKSVKSITTVSKKLIERPATPEKERAEMIAALDIVDYVVIFDEPDPRKFLECVKPDFHAKGKDWEGKRIPEMDVLEKYGGKMVYINLVPGHSTTDLIRKIVSAYLHDHIEKLNDGRN